MKAHMNTPSAAILFALLLMTTTEGEIIIGSEETVTITVSRSELDYGYDGKTAYIGELEDTRLTYYLQRPIIANRGLRLIGRDAPLTGFIFACWLDNPTFYSGSFTVSKYLPTNSIVNVDVMVATMQTPMSVIDLKDAYLSNNITIAITRGTVTYSGDGAAAPVVSMVSSGGSVLSRSTLSIVGLRVSGAATVLSIGDITSMEDAKIMGDAMLTIDKCTVADLGVAVVDFVSGMSLWDHSVFRVSALTVSSGSAPVVRYASGRGQRLTSGSLYVLQNINSPQGDVLELESGAQATFFTSDNRSTVSFLDITAAAMGVTESVPRSPSDAQVYGQQCSFNNALLANTVDAYNSAFIAATKVLASLRDVDTQECQAALCIPEYTTSMVDISNTCGCECDATTQQDMCSINQDLALGTVLCNADTSCYKCITPNECSECLPSHEFSGTENTCVSRPCTEENCDACGKGGSCIRCKELFIFTENKKCIPCTAENCRHCRPRETSSQCDACDLGYTVSNGTCIPYVPCTAPHCDKCVDGSSDVCERCAPSFGTTSAGICLRCASVNCLACGDGSSACTECAKGFRLTDDGCELDAAAGLLHAGWLVLTLAVVAHAVCFF